MGREHENRDHGERVELELVMNMNKTNNGHFRQNVCFVVSVSKSALGILYKI